MKNIFLEYPEFIESDVRTARPNDLTGSYTITNDLQYQRHMLAIGNLQGLSVLDLGCCVGATGAWALANGAINYVGVELQSDFCLKATENLSKYFPHGNWQIKNQSFDDFFKSNTEKFDVVIALGVIYHSIYFETLLNNIALVCKSRIIIDSHEPCKVKLFTNHIALDNVPYIEYDTNYGMVNDAGVFPTPYRISAAIPNIPALTILLGHHDFQLDKNTTPELKILFPEAYAKRFIVGFIKSSTKLKFSTTEDVYHSTVIPDKWEFNASVAKTFGIHARQHIPKYDEIIDQSIVICKKLFNKEARIIDVGCATGQTIQRFTWQGFTNLVGVDNSTDMLEKAKLTAQATWVLSDDFPVNQGPYHAVICNWTLHFIKNKISYLEKIYSSLDVNGIVIITDKTANDGIELDLYHDFKRRQGVSNFEIQQKADSVKDIMFINNTEWYINTLRSIGFSHVAVINATPCFTTFLVKK